MHACAALLGGDFERAIEITDQSCDPDEWEDGLLSLISADAHRALGRFDDARAALDRSQSLIPD